MRFYVGGGQGFGKYLEEEGHIDVDHKIVSQPVQQNSAKYRLI